MVTVTCLTVFGKCSESDKPLTDMLIIYSVQSKMDLSPCGSSVKFTDKFTVPAN